MDMVALLDAWSKRQAGERQALADCPTCRDKVTRPCRLVLGGGVQARIRDEWEHTSAKVTVRLPRRRGHLCRAFCVSYSALRAVRQGIVP